MIESVEERQRGGTDFATYYDNLCALQNICPIAAVKAHLHEGVLDINGDRIRAKEWPSILNSIKINKNLRFIAVRSYYQSNLDEASADKRAQILRTALPSIREKPILSELARSIRSCLTLSENVKYIELQGLPLRVGHCKLISKGIGTNKTLTHLSFEDSPIGDEGLAAITEGLRQAGNVVTLNLTACSLTSNTAETLAALIKYQGMCRHSAAWQESLRYRFPNLDSMPGVRRITLNNNPLFEDRGALILAEVLKDDLWVKAIDMQSCGLTTVAARAFLGGVLKFNSTLVILDLRSNPLIDRDILRAVTEQVLINGDGKDSQYKWLKVKSHEDRHHRDQQESARLSFFRKETASSQKSSNGNAKRPIFRPAGVLNLDRLHNRALDNPAIRQRTRSLDRDINSSSDRTTPPPPMAKDSKGQPWRTAARASRYKGYPPHHTPGKSHLDEQIDDLKDGRGLLDDESSNEEGTNDFPATYTKSRRPLAGGKDKSKERKPPPNDPEATARANFIVDSLLEEFHSAPPLPEEIKEMKIEIVRLRRQIKEEVELRRQYEKTMADLRKENQRLERHLNALKGREVRLSSSTMDGMSGDHHRGQKADRLLDDALLESIEQSFKQFHAFLDLLRDSGLGRVVSAAGMDNFTPTLPKKQTRPKTAHNDKTRGKNQEKSHVKHNGNTNNSNKPTSPLEESRKRAQKAKIDANRLYDELKADTLAFDSHNEKSESPAPSSSLHERDFRTNGGGGGITIDAEAAGSPFPAPRTSSLRTSASDSQSLRPIQNLSESFGDIQHLEIDDEEEEMHHEQQQKQQQREEEDDSQRTPVDSRASSPERMLITRQPIQNEKNDKLDDGDDDVSYIEEYSQASEGDLMSIQSREDGGSSATEEIIDVDKAQESIFHKPRRGYLDTDSDDDDGA